MAEYPEVIPTAPQGTTTNQPASTQFVSGALQAYGPSIPVPGTIGSVPYFNTPTTLAGSLPLTAFQLVLGGDSAGPSPLGSVGTAGQSLLSQGAGLAPTWGAAQGLTGPQGPQGIPGTPGATGPGYLATSTTAQPIGLGAHTVVTQPGLAYTIGARIRLASHGTPTQWMEGPITAYDPVGGSMTMVADLTNATVAGAQVVEGGFRNKFRNPGFDIAQRGTSGTVATGTTAYTLDGWIVGASAAAAPWLQVYNSVISGNALRLNCASGLAVTLTGRIESTIAAQLLTPGGAPQPITVQFTIYNNSGLLLTPSISTAMPNARDNWGAGVTTDLPNTSLLAINSGSVATLAYTFTPSALLANGYQFTLALGLNAATGFVVIGSADVRSAPNIPTGFNFSPQIPELRPPGVELVNCQRYLNIWTGGAFGSPGSATDNMRNWSFVFPTAMRAVPVISGVAYTPTGVPGVTSTTALGFAPNNNIGNTNSTVQITAWTASSEL
jgi:hypothetical protein